MTHGGTCLMVEHVCVKFGDPIAASNFEISCGKTDRETNKMHLVRQNSLRFPAELYDTVLCESIKNDQHGLPA